ncbi:MAG: NmrA family NAD(P)-binding protein [Gemmatimonadetes bacterium]|nr:NmrA family NAD(P)-binding protein [Gemmatimonadota bacterium]
MRVLVTGGTGTVGSTVVKALQGKAEVSVLTRDPEKAKRLPQGVKGVVGNLLDIGTIRSVFKGYDSVFLVTVVSPTEATEGLLALNGIRDAGVKRVVYLSVQDAERAVHLPHFGSKVPVEMAIQASGLAGVILRPNNFYQNDVWYQQALLNYGVYPQPLGSAGVSRVDVRDIADAAVIALTTSKLDGQTLNLVGPDALTGLGTAEIWSKALGKPVKYAGDDMDSWEKQNLAYGIPPVLAYDFRLMYEWFQTKGLKASKEDLAELTNVLGHAPRKYADYVNEMAKAWKTG